MDVSKYIADFLVSKGFVNLPGLGSFSSTYTQARFTEDNKTLLPPGRIYSFDPTKITYDNQLALFIAGKENTPVSVAEKEVEEFVEGCHYVINKGKRLEIKGIGLLFKNDAEEIEFELDPNLLTENDFYGLPEIMVKPTGRTSRKSFNRAKLVMLVFILTGIVFGGFYATKVADYLKEKIFSPGIPDTSKPISNSNDSVLKDTVSVTDTSLPVHDSLTDETEIKEETPPPVEKITETPPREMYYVVAGCFRSEEGAKKTVTQLKGKGYEARIFGMSKQGLHMVCYNSYESKEEAKKFLSKITAETDPKAWLIKY
ncbi:MAG: SPOR domain-containing protein [Bacteroidales bacterium]